MIPADLALANIVNQTSTVFERQRPAYMTYQEHTHISVPSLGRSGDIDRSVAVRVSDDLAVMHDLPQGATRTGPAFPIIPSFNPFSWFTFTYPALIEPGGRINRGFSIDLKQGADWHFVVPAADPNVNGTIFYIPYWIPNYAPDATADRVHLSIAAGPDIGRGAIFPSGVTSDASNLASEIQFTENQGPTQISLDFAVQSGFWIVTHLHYESAAQAGPFTIKYAADTTFDQFAFPATAPDPQLQ
ncbi:MAG: hypothetical protein JOZ38_05970 [Candidatus Eremiobacteraeota bacterium]|nr:hypothetical protein [Candidatus Eremiobacteraeota bacterium]